jgi:hypothetical protein
MQSGKARTADWLLEFEPAEAKRPDPLMGWAGSGDTQQQVVLRFGSEGSEGLCRSLRHRGARHADPAAQAQAAELRRQFPLIRPSGRKAGQTAALSPYAPPGSGGR